MVSVTNPIIISALESMMHPRIASTAAALNGTITAVVIKKKKKLPVNCSPSAVARRLEKEFRL